MYDRESLQRYIERVYREPAEYAPDAFQADLCFAETVSMPISTGAAHITHLTDESECAQAPRPAEETEYAICGAAPAPRPDEPAAVEKKAVRKKAKRRAPLFGARKAVLSQFRVEREEEAEEPLASMPKPKAAKKPADANGAVPDASYSYGMPAPKFEVDESFRDALFRLIDEKGLRDPDVYKRAEIDRRHFAKIRNDYDNAYRPSKKTALRLALALGLSLDETNAFIGRAGYSLSRSILSDVIVMYFLENGVTDLATIDEALFEQDQQTLTE
jgi:hypothetical protein